MSECDCTLEILFRDGDAVVASLKIAYASDNMQTCGSVPDIAPDYIGRDSTENIMFVSSKEKIDGSTPIQIYLGSDPDICPIMLLEERDYELLLTGDVDRAFPYITDNSGEMSLRKVHFGGPEGGSIYRLAFRNYVGKGFFDIVSGGRTISVPFEVRSRKIGYLDEYPRMLEDIADFSASLLLSSKSPLFSNMHISDRKSRTTYEDFLVLDWIFSKKDISGAYEQIRANRHREMLPVKETVPAGMVRGMDPSDIVDLVSSGNLVPMENGPIAGRFAPLEAIERIHEDDYDTPENRVVKDTLVRIRDMILTMKNASDARGSSYISNRLSGMLAVTESHLSDPWLAEVGNLTQIPYSSTVLGGRAGYVEMFRIHQILGLGAMFRQEDAEDLLRGQNNRVYQVYEYWCYTRLFRSLSRMSSNKPLFPFVETDGKWSMSIRRDVAVSFLVSIDGIELEVKLYFNKTYSQNSSGFRSYSVPLRPDYTLVITRFSEDSGRYIVNFDAKYRAQSDSESEVQETGCQTFLESDICKMHTYRNALIHSWGSYILFPGGKEVIYPEPTEDDWDGRFDHILPSVGVIPLIPGSETDASLDSALESILSEIARLTGSEMRKA